MTSPSSTGVLDLAALLDAEAADLWSREVTDTVEELAMRIAILEARNEQLRRVMVAAIHLLGQETRHHTHLPDRIDWRGSLIGRVVILEGDVQAAPKPDVFHWWDDPVPRSST